MFVRKKRNKSGVISVQIIDKSPGKYKMIKTIGSSSDEKKIEQLVELGKDWIETNTNSLAFDFNGDRQSTEDVLNNIEQINISGTSLLLGKLFDEVGFDKIGSELFKNLVILGVIDKKEAVFSLFFPSGQKGGCFFCSFLIFIYRCFIFDLSS